MAECSESDGELFITQSKYSSREVGSDTDNVLSGILHLEECRREWRPVFWHFVRTRRKILHGDRGNSFGEKKVKKDENEEGGKNTEIEIEAGDCEKMLSVITKTIKFWCVMSWMTNKLN